jgi:predicted nucleotidyltransferase
VASAAELQLVALLHRLTAAGVDFVVVGGVAVAVQGYGRATKDLDITYATGGANLERLGTALLELRARLRGVDEAVPFIPDPAALKRMAILTLDTDEGPLDLLLRPDGAPPYERMRERADVVDLDGAPIRVVAIDDLLSMKRAAGRPQDLADIDALEAAKRMRRRR